MRDAARPIHRQSQEAIAGAAAGAADTNPEVAPAHLLVALLEQDDGLVAPILQKLGADLAAIRSAAPRGGRGAADS